MFVGIVPQICYGSGLVAGKSQMLHVKHVQAFLEHIENVLNKGPVTCSHSEVFRRLYFTIIIYNGRRAMKSVEKLMLELAVMGLKPSNPSDGYRLKASLQNASTHNFEIHGRFFLGGFL